MTSVFDTMYFEAPYKDLDFPGKSSDEIILYVTRESPLFLAWRLGISSFVIAILILVSVLLVKMLGSMLGFGYVGIVVLIVVLGFVVMMGGLWWVWQVYKKTVFIITTRRLTKFIHTTPWTRYQMSLGLDKIVDSGSYSKGYLQALFGLGTFVARSSAGNIKNFKIVNIKFAEDLHNWMNNLLFVFNKNTDELDKFRPFVPKKRGMRY